MKYYINTIIIIIIIIAYTHCTSIYDRPAYSNVENRLFAVNIHNSFCANLHIHMQPELLLRQHLYVLYDKIKFV